MTDSDHDAVLAEMATRRRDARWGQHRRDAVMRLLDRDGAVDAAALDKHMTDTWTEPSRADTASQMAQKAHAAVEHTAAQVEVWEQKVRDAHAAAELAQTHAETAAGAVTEIVAALAAAQDAHDAAAALAAYVDGDPYQAPPPARTDAPADTAVATAEGA